MDVSLGEGQKNWLALFSILVLLGRFLGNDVDWVSAHRWLTYSARSKQWHVKCVCVQTHGEQMLSLMSSSAHMVVSKLTDITTTWWNQHLHDCLITESLKSLNDGSLGACRMTEWTDNEWELRLKDVGCHWLITLVFKAHEQIRMIVHWMQLSLEWLRWSVLLENYELTFCENTL